LAVHPLILSGYGLVEAPFNRTVERFGSQARADQSQIRVVTVTADVSEALDHLSIRTVPATRLVAIDCGSRTAILTNHRNGSSFAEVCPARRTHHERRVAHAGGGARLLT
jgi:hypothetical protein